MQRIISSYQLFILLIMLNNTIQYIRNIHIKNKQCITKNKRNIFLSDVINDSNYIHRSFHNSSCCEDAIVNNQHLLSVAPMMEYTDRHQRLLHRLISKETVLYTGLHYIIANINFI